MEIQISQPLQCFASLLRRVSLKGAVTANCQQEPAGYSERPQQLERGALPLATSGRAEPQSLVAREWDSQPVPILAHSHLLGAVPPSQRDHPAHSCIASDEEEGDPSIGKDIRKSCWNSQAQESRAQASSPLVTGPAATLLRAWQKGRLGVGEKTKPDRGMPEKTKTPPSSLNFV